MSADVLEDIQNICHFIAHINRNNFCIGDVLKNNFLWHFWAIKEKGCPIDVCGHPWGRPKYTPFYWSHKQKQLLYWRRPQKIISCSTYVLSKKKDVPLMSADVLGDVQDICNFISQINTNIFCISDVHGKTFLVALMGYQRKRTSH